MKKGRFLWSAHRITERQKAGKARSIKGKQLKNSRSQVSKQRDVLLSSQRDNNPRDIYPGNVNFPGFLLFNNTLSNSIHIYLFPFAMLNY